MTGVFLKFHSTSAANRTWSIFVHRRIIRFIMMTSYTVDVTSFRLETHAAWTRNGQLSTFIKKIYVTTVHDR